MELAAGLVAWRPEYEVHVKVIDQQHKGLIGIVRSFQEAMLADEARAVLSSTLSKLRIYAQVHFSLEERLMQEHGYPELEEHKAAHQRLTEQVGELQARVASNKPIPTAEVIVFLRHWLTDHILAEDTKLGSHLCECGVQ